MSKLYEALKKIEKKELGRKGDKKIPYTLHRKSTKHLLVIVVFLLIIFGGGFIVVTYTEKKIAHIPPAVGNLVKQVNESDKQQIKKEITKETVKREEKVTAVEEMPPVKKEKTAIVKKKLVLAYTSEVKKNEKKSVKKPVRIKRAMVSDIKKGPVQKRMSTYNITALSLEAQRATERGEIEKAVDIYKKLLRIRKSDIYLMNNLGALYVMEGKYTNAQLILKKAYDICTDIDIALNYANALYKGGNKRTAQTVLKHINPLLLKTGEQKETYRTLKHLLENW